MSKYVTVHVTQEDIDAAREHPGVVHIQSCPLARACRRTVYDEAWVGLAVWGTDLTRDDGPLAPLTTRARSFVLAFDEGKSVQPATFRLPLPMTGGPAQGPGDE